MRHVLNKSLTIRGFIQSEFVPEHHDRFLEEMGAWVREGRVRYREDVVEGLEHAPEAFIGMLRGRNFGKLLVKV
jgi:NADPH-dependent curcumin reductase CurA